MLAAARTLLLLNARAPPPHLSAVPFTPLGAAEFADEPADAAWAMANTMQKVDVAVLDMSIPTTFSRFGSGKKKLLFFHGADSSCLEWRFMLKRLGGEFDCISVD